MIAQGNAPGLTVRENIKPCKGDTISRGRGEGFFEDGLEVVGGVGARVRDFKRQRADARGRAVGNNSQPAQGRLLSSNNER